MTEECNVGFVRLFDSFLESAPQKILQLAIVFRSTKHITNYRLIAFVVYFGSIAWCIQAYNRSNRLVQMDKHDIAAKGRFLQFIFLLCLTVSRTLCIGYVASLFPIETLTICAVHACFCGTTVFLVDSPMIAESRFMNYLYCLCFGIVYLFIFTPVKDAPTKYKYLYYLTFCLLQNTFACVLFIPLDLSIAIIALYILGIILIIIYYTNCHPNTIPTYF
ncbi:XK-related protein 6 isoform X2 [Drosophila eugracilis]|nr:XK-related protein 6 isoform X2 [Drosophila eugracilis]